MPDRILIFSDWFTPGFRAGGPIRSLVNLTEAVGLPFDIITRNTDHYSSIPYDLPVGEWIQHSTASRRQQPVDIRSAILDEAVKLEKREGLF